MKTKRTSNLLGILMMSLSLLLTTSCDKDDDRPNDPDGAIMLNMLDEQSGKTLLGGSGVYINKANNFYTSSSLMSDAGSVNGLGVQIAPKLGNLVSEVAVTPGHIYQVFDKSTVHDFPSGVRALQVSAAYYKVYVVSSNPTGAVVKYVTVYPDLQGLPEAESTIGEVRNSGESVSVDLPKGAECFWYDGVPEAFWISVNNGVLQMTLSKQPSEFNGMYGSYKIYIRLGEVYTMVCVHVVR